MGDDEEVGKVDEVKVGKEDKGLGDLAEVEEDEV